jgi:phosphoribosyl-ATP pyrophosphohydrolase
MKKTKKKKFVDVVVEMTDETFMTLALMAHEENVTFNALVNKLLMDKMKKR